MDWRSVPTGMMRNNEILNALLATWKVQFNNAIRNGDRRHFDGAEEGLDAFAQAAGLIEEFEAGKVHHRARFTARAAWFIEGQVEDAH